LEYCAALRRAPIAPVMFSFSVAQRLKACTGQLLSLLHVAPFLKELGWWVRNHSFQGI
jgi:hypothetical protein